MMRLIDADALKKIISGNSYILRDSINSMNFGMFWEGIEQAIDEAQTIDAIPVVRCKDCKYKDPNALSTQHDSIGCVLIRGVFPLDHYCSYGERKDNE